jgi:hypothetical protein
MAFLIVTAANTLNLACNKFHRIIQISMNVFQQIRTRHSFNSIPSWSKLQAERCTLSPSCISHFKNKFNDAKTVAFSAFWCVADIKFISFIFIFIVVWFKIFTVVTIKKPSSGMLRLVAFARADVSEEYRLLQKPNGVTSQKTAFLTCIVVDTYIYLKM